MSFTTNKNTVLNILLKNSALDYVVCNSKRLIDMKAQIHGDDIYINCQGELVFFGTFQPTVVLIRKNCKTHDKIYLDRHMLNCAQTLLLLSGDVEMNPGPVVAEMYHTCVGAFYFGQDIPDFVEFVHDLKCWDFNEGEDYDFTPLLFQPTDKKMYKFLSQIMWDEVKHLAMFHLPYRFRFMLNDLDLSSEWAIIERLLMLSGDVETNPGPLQSRPSQYRYNDPRVVRLENALHRRDEKIKTLIKHLRQQIKSNQTKVYCQIFDDVRGTMGDMSANLNRMCDFLENSLPGLQANMQAHFTHAVDKYVSVKDDLIKLTLICVVVKLMMCMKRYKSALAVLLVFICKFYGLDGKIMELVMELKSKLIRREVQTMPEFKAGLEETIYHPYFHTCGKLLFAVIAFFCIRKIPGKQDWDNYISRLDRIPKALDGSKKIMDYCSEYFNLATDYVKMLVLGKTREELRRFHGLYGEIHEWAKEVRSFLELEQRNKIDTDITVANKAESLYHRGLKFKADPLLDRDMDRLVTSSLIPARALFEYVSCSPIKGGGPRMRPVCVWLTGESGVGKTEMVYPLCIDVLRTMGLMKKEDFHHQVYGRQVETEFWDGYKGQKIVIYDDAFQMKDDKTAANPEIFEVIRSCNTFPQHLHMAALHDKNTFSNAELLLYTTNDMNVKLESITFPDAFFNRIGEHAYRVQPKIEYALVVPRGNSGTYMRKLDHTKLNPDVPIDLNVYEFQKLVRDECAEGKWIERGPPINYGEFSQMICEEWRKQKERSMNKLKFLESYAIRAQVGEDFVDCVYDDDFFNNDIASNITKGVDFMEIEALYADDDVIFKAYTEYKARQRRPGIWDKMKDRMDNALQRVSGYLSGLYEESSKIIREHPYLSVLGLLGMALSAFTLYKWLENSFSEEEVVADAEVGVSGDAKSAKVQKLQVEMNTLSIEEQRQFVETMYGQSLIGAGTIALMKKNKWGIYSEKYDCQAEVGVSGDSRTAKQQVKRVEVGVSGDAKTKNVAQKRVEVADEKLLAMAQGCSDQVAHNLVTDILQKNTYRLTYMRGEKRVPFGNCTFVRGWVFVMPYHFLHALYARKLAPEAIISFSQSKFEDIIQIPLSHLMTVGVDGFELTKNCERVSFKDGTYRDCVVVNLHRRMCHPHRDLVKHFVKTSDQGSLQGSFNGTLATFHENGKDLHRTYQWLQKIRPLDKQITIYYPEDGFDYGSESYTQRDCYEYNAPTQVGDCGSIIGLYNNRMERKLIGMHIAGTNQEYGYACPLTQELIDDACEKLIGKDFRNISAQFYYEIPKNVDPTVEPILPDGLFCPLGKADKKVGQATKTAIIPSCIQGELSEPFMKPALLKPTMIDGVLHDPLLKGLKKCGVDTAVLSDEEVKSAAMDVAQLVLTQTNSMIDRAKYQRILTYEEAVRGTLDDDFMKAVNRTTSPGYPYSLQNKGKPGKTRWMGKDEKFDFESMEAQQLRADVDELIEDCRIGKISNVFFVDTLKDERREKAKVDVGKTRVFSAGPQHFVVAFRKYFLPFAAWLMHNRIDNEVAVGSNPYSLDWERIAKRLKSKGKHVIAGDFGNFDGSLVAQILWAIFWEIFVPWLEMFNDLNSKEGRDILKICLGLWAHLVHSVHIFGDNVYMWTHSQPSGNPFTVIINCLYNSIIMRISWIRIMRRDCPSYMSMKFFRLFVALITYGDDNAANIADKVIHLFNQETISAIMAEMKHEYTDEGKSGTIIKSRQLEDIFFLKRGFRFCPELQRTVAPLKIEVIYEMLNWTRNTIDPNVILMSNINTAFREVVNHGRDAYDELYRGIMRIAVKLPAIPQISTYEQYLHDLTYLADEVYEF